MMNLIKCFYITRRFYTTKNFDKLIGLDFPSSRMQNNCENPDYKKKENSLKNILHNLRFNKKEYLNINNKLNDNFDPILGLDFPSSRFK